MELPKELAEALDALVAGITSLTERAAKEDADKAALVEAEAAAAAAPKEVDPLEVVAKLAESKLSAPAQARVLASVKGGAELEEAIKAEKEYVAEVLKESAAFAADGSEELTEAAGSKIGASIFGIQD